MNCAISCEDLPIGSVSGLQCPYERTNFNEDDVEATDSRFNVEDLGGDD